MYIVTPLQNIITGLTRGIPATNPEHTMYDINLMYINPIKSKLSDTDTFRFGVRGTICCHSHQWAFSYQTYIWLYIWVHYLSVTMTSARAKDLHFCFIQFVSRMKKKVQYFIKMPQIEKQTSSPIFNKIKKKINKIRKKWGPRARHAHLGETNITHMYWQTKCDTFPLLPLKPKTISGGLCNTEWSALCENENVSPDISGQRRPRSACAFAQSDQGLRCPQTEIFG